MKLAVIASLILERLTMRFSAPAILKDLCIPQTPSTSIFPKPVSQADKITRFKLGKERVSTSSGVQIPSSELSSNNIWEVHALFAPLKSKPALVNMLQENNL